MTVAFKNQLAILEKGVKTWNKWRAEKPKTRINLSGADLSEADLNGADFSKANLSGANLGEACLTGANLTGANLSKADLSEAGLIYAVLVEANLHLAHLNGADLSNADLSEADLSRAGLCGANFTWAKLGNADLSKADLSEAIFFWSNFSEANLREANLSEADFNQANFSAADLSHANLSGADLSQANLKGADLSMANLHLAFLSGADLSGADLSGADLSMSHLTRVDLTGANLCGARLSLASLVESNLTGATLTGCNIYGISAWNLELENAEQSNLVITHRGEPTVMVDELEVAQFVYMLLNREKLRDVLNTMTKTGVLILGRFKDGGLEVLQAIAEGLREKGYLPMLFDFDASDNRDFTETVKIMAGLARFIVVDLSGPSVPKELEATVPDFEVPFIPIIEKGREFPSMTMDLTKYPWFRWPPVEFDNKEHLLQMLKEAVISPANEMGKARDERRTMLFPEK